MVLINLSLVEVISNWIETTIVLETTASKVKYQTTIKLNPLPLVDKTVLWTRMFKRTLALVPNKLALLPLPITHTRAASSKRRATT